MLAELYGWTPQEIADMTIAQIFGCLISANDKKDVGYSQAVATANAAKQQRQQWSRNILRQLR